MHILIRITSMAWRYRTRLTIAYITFFLGIGASLLIPWLFGESIDALVLFEDGQLIPQNPAVMTLLLLAVGLLVAS